MGRHAADPASDGPADPGPEVQAEASEAAPTTVPDAAQPPETATHPWWREAVVFGLVGAIATGAVLRWAVGGWWVALLGGLAAAAVVTVATRVARSVPAPER